MLHNTFCRRLAALVLTLAVAVSAVLPVFAVYPMPIQTASETEAVYLFNADTGKTLLTQNADQPRYVASLTKMMTALLVLEAIDSGKLKKDQQITASAVPNTDCAGMKLYGLGAE